MGRFIMHHEGRFFEWSTVVDAPVTDPMGLEAYKARYREEHGSLGMVDLEGRLERALAKGTSAMGSDTFDDVVFLNRMGRGERRLSVEAVKAWVMGFSV